MEHSQGEALPTSVDVLCDSSTLNIHVQGTFLLAMKPITLSYDSRWSFDTSEYIGTLPLDI